MNSVALKRRHNFVDEFYQHQSKIYVTERTLFSRSSELTEQKTTIHKKTLEMLYLGAKKQKQTGSAPAIKQCCWTCPHFSQPSNDQHKKYKQMQITASGQLVSPQFNVTTDIEMNLSGIESAEVSRCSYCDLSLNCTYCRQECQRCHLIFCPQCCLSMSHCADDVYLCLSCTH